MNENVERVLGALDGFRMADEMTSSAYSNLYDAISGLDDLLKEQESFQPFRSGVYHPDWCCGNCKYPGLYGRMKFCPECGKAVKWE